MIKYYEAVTDIDFVCYTYAGYPTIGPVGIGIGGTRAAAVAITADVSVSSSTSGT